MPTPAPSAPESFVLSPVSERELAQRRSLYGLTTELEPTVALLRKLVGRNAAPICERAALELAGLPWAGHRATPRLSLLVSEAALGVLFRVAYDVVVANRRVHLGATHAWLGLDAHALVVIAEALAQSVEATMDAARVTSEARSPFRRLVAFDHGVRMDGYAFAASQVGPGQQLEVALSSLVSGARAAGRVTDIISRTGGQELCVALPDCTREGAEVFLLRWLHAVPLDLEIGLCVAGPLDVTDAGDLIAAARPTRRCRPPGRNQRSARVTLAQRRQQIHLFERAPAALHYRRHRIVAKQDR